MLSLSNIVTKRQNVYHNTYMYCTVHRTLNYLRLFLLKINISISISITFSANTNILSFLMFPLYDIITRDASNLHTFPTKFSIILAYSAVRLLLPSIEQKRFSVCFIIEICEVFRKALLCISYLPDAMGFCYFSLGVYNNVEMNISFTSYHELNYIRSRFEFTEHS